MHLIAYWFHPSCPQGLYTCVWYLVTGICQSLPSSWTQSQSHCSCRSAQSWIKGLLCLILGGWNRGMPTLPCIPNTSLSELSTLCPKGDVKYSAFLRAVVWEVPRADGKSRVSHVLSRRGRICHIWLVQCFYLHQYSFNTCWSLCRE